MVMVTETRELHLEKAELYRKLDKSSNYKTDEEREIDEKRIGEIETEVCEIQKKYMQQQKVEIAQQVQKVTDMKEAKKLLKDKYEKYRQVTIQARDFVDGMVEKKKEGRDLMERISKAKGKPDKILVGDILKF